MSQDYSARIGLLFENTQLAAYLAEQLSYLIKYVPVVNVTSDNAEDTVVPQAQTFLVSDWKLEHLKGYCSPERFAAVILVRPAESTNAHLGMQIPVNNNVSYIESDDQVGMHVAEEIVGRIFPLSDDKQLELAIQNKQHLRLLDHIGKELSVFYHNISNPLTILSGNIQLLQILAESINISDDLMKPIEDIAIVSSRFEQDLKAITELREKIRAGSLQKEEV